MNARERDPRPPVAEPNFQRAEQRTARRLVLRASALLVAMIVAGIVLPLCLAFASLRLSWPLGPLAFVWAIALAAGLLPRILTGVRLLLAVLPLMFAKDSL